MELLSYEQRAKLSKEELKRYRDDLKRYRAKVFKQTLAVQEMKPVKFKFKEKESHNG